MGAARVWEIETVPLALSVEKNRLQPSLFDRLEDELAPTLARLDVAREALQEHLDGEQRLALAELLGQEPARDCYPVAPESGALAGLNAEAQVQLDRVLELERARRSDLRRAITLSSAQLRAAVLRDLHI